MRSSFRKYTTSLQIDIFAESTTGIGSAPRARSTGCRAAGGVLWRFGVQEGAERWLAARLRRQNTRQDLRARFLHFFAPMRAPPSRRGGVNRPLRPATRRLCGLDLFPIGASGDHPSTRVPEDPDCLSPATLTVASWPGGLVIYESVTFSPLSATYHSVDGQPTTITPSERNSCSTIGRILFESASALLILMRSISSFRRRLLAFRYDMVQAGGSQEP